MNEYIRFYSKAELMAFCLKFSELIDLGHNNERALDMVIDRKKAPKLDSFRAEADLSEDEPGSHK